MKPLLACTLLCALLATDAVSGSRDHEGGIFARVAAGLTTGSSSIDDDATGTHELSGVGLDGEVAVGYVISPSLAVHGTFFAWRISDPGIGRVGGTAVGTMIFSAVGAGITYYIMPTNLYLSLSLAGATLEIDNDGLVSKSGTGFGLEFLVGKEWFIADRLGIGGSVGLVYHSVPDVDIDARWSGLYLPLRLSVTYN